MTELKLLGCPMCGEQPKMTKNEWVYRISCHKGTLQHEVTILGLTAQKVIEEWNTRFNEKEQENGS